MQIVFSLYINQLFNDISMNFISFNELLLSIPFYILSTSLAT